MAIEPDPAEATEDLQKVVEAATGFYQERLHWRSNVEVRDYLNRRGFDRAIAQEWKLGYAPLSWNALTQDLRQLGFDDELIVGSGVAGRASNGRLYDLMRGRLIFPILDADGQTRGFAGRLLKGDGPKNLNGPETSLYTKRTLLYGIHTARDHIDKEGVAVVVAGYTDVLAAHQAGVRNVVGTGGTALTKGHLTTLANHATQVVLAFDGDAAGQLAAEHNVEWAREAPVRMAVAQLPAGRDPAGLLREGDKDLFGQAVADAAPLTTYLIDRIIERANLDEVEGPIRMMLAAATIIHSIETRAERASAVSHLATRLGRDQEFIQSAIDRYADSPQRQRSRDLGRSL